MDDSPLATLPRELRDIIYCFALQGEEEICLARTGRFSGRIIGRRRSGFYTPTRSLAATCKQLYIEASPVFFKTNSFRIYTALDTSTSLADFDSWMGKEDNKCSVLAGSVDLDLGQLNTSFHKWLRPGQYQYEFLRNEIVRFIKPQCTLTKWTVSMAIHFHYKTLMLKLDRLPLLYPGYKIQRIKDQYMTGDDSQQVDMDPQQHAFDPSVHDDAFLRGLRERLDDLGGRFKELLEDIQSRIE